MDFFTWKIEFRAAVAKLVILHAGEFNENNIAEIPSVNYTVDEECKVHTLDFQLQNN